MKKFLLIIGLVVLFGAEILRVYFIMPFPGSQKANTIDIAYFLSRHIWWFRIGAVLLLLYPTLSILSKAKTWQKILLIIGFIIYGVVAYMLNFSMEADKMFYQPTHLYFANAAGNKIPQDKLVVGLMVNGFPKAYPIQLIGYHHQVVDTISDVPLMVTYCTVCRTGRAYSNYIRPLEAYSKFRLVGMDHFNAMFEDSATKSWWQQSTGIAIAGPLKGTALNELPTEQMTLAAWLRKYPSSLIMQPDSVFKEKFEKMGSYDKGLSKSDLTRRDTGSWKPKSWVVGVQHLEAAKAFDWNQLVKQRMIQDSLSLYPVVLLLEKDTASFHAYNRLVDGVSLRFIKTGNPDVITDINTGSSWNMDGQSIAGPLMGKKMQPAQAYQEFWHSWQTFHPGTVKSTGF